MKKKEESLGVTFAGSVTFNGPMFDIHDNQNVYVGKPDKDLIKEKPSTSTTNEDEPERNEELFKFICPSVPSDQEWLIHDEVKRLVTRQGIQEICLYLKQLADEKKIYLPISPGAAYKELTRMGMPQGEGFNEKTFQKYYKR